MRLRPSRDDSGVTRRGEPVDARKRVPPLRSLRDIKEIPFPGLTIVGRESLTPNGTLLVPRIPTKDDNDRLTLEGIFAKEMADAIFK